MVVLRQLEQMDLLRARLIPMEEGGQVYRPQAQPLAPLFQIQIFLRRHQLAITKEEEEEEEEEEDGLILQVPVVHT